MKTNNRIIIVDTLRGFALFLIILIHFIEHFELFAQPEINFIFSQPTDSAVMETIILLISGKAYSVFALLFGFSFFIQIDRKAQQGIDFRGTFLWRIIILLIFGFIHSLIYRGDILHIYALLGILLLPFYRIKTKYLIAVSILLVLQIPVILDLIRSFTVSGYEYKESIPVYWSEGNEVYKSGSLADVIYYNFWKGRVSVWAWTIYNGRYLQLFTLFLAGLLLGRHKIFENIRKYRKHLSLTVLFSVVAFAVFKAAFYFISKTGLNETQHHLIKVLIDSYSNLAATAFLVAIIILLYMKFEKARVFYLFGAYGKMSLTNYVFQAVSGVILFYGFGFGLYKYIGSTWSLLMGIAVFFLQAYASEWWNKKYYYGPLEWFWRALTFRDFGLKMKK